MIDLNRSRGVTAEDDMVGVTTKGSNVITNPLQCLVNIQDTKVLRLRACAELGRVWISPDALASVEADEDDTVASKVGTLVSRVAARACDHGTTVHPDENR